MTRTSRARKTARKQKTAVDKARKQKAADYKAWALKQKVATQQAATRYRSFYIHGSTYAVLTTDAV